MKYLNGDIVINIKTRLIFVWDDTSLDKNRKTIFQTRLATPGEAHIFKTKFPGAKVATFAHFKEEMCVFDGRKLGRSIIYAHIELREDEYLYFRNFRNDKFIHARTFEHKLAILISEYELAKSKVDDLLDPYYQKIMQVEKLVKDVMNDIESKIGTREVHSQLSGLIKKWQRD
jgi:hypothetical protein